MGQSPPDPPRRSDAIGVAHSPSPLRAHGVPAASSSRGSRWVDRAPWRHHRCGRASARPRCSRRALSRRGRVGGVPPGKSAPGRPGRPRIGSTIPAGRYPRPRARSCSRTRGGARGRDPVPGCERLDDGHRDRARRGSTRRRPRSRRPTASSIRRSSCEQPAPRRGMSSPASRSAKVFSAGRLRRLSRSPRTSHQGGPQPPRATTCDRHRRAAARAQATVDSEWAAVTLGGSPSGDNGRDALARRGRQRPGHRQGRRRSRVRPRAPSTRR